MNQEHTSPSSEFEVPSQPRLSLALLGATSIRCNGRPLVFGYDKVLALLIYLAVEGERLHRRSTLVGLLWPEQDEQAARHSLSQALWHLRRALHDTPAYPLLHTTRDTVALGPSPEIWLDVAAFGQHLSADDGSELERAVALYNGDFLSDLPLSPSVEFEEWVLVKRERLREQACAALQRLSDPQDWGEHAGKACSFARRWAELDPLCEEAHRRTMLLLARMGQRTAALAQFEQCRRILQTELHIEPEPATSALYETIKHSVAPAPAPVAKFVREALPLPPTSLVGRKRELAELQGLLADPANRLITVTGPGGVGKTRLALHAALAVAPSFADGVFFVPLAAVRESPRASPPGRG
ncbi:SARP family transcriptional regulator, partial [Candidatus Gracilibacteria bacterium]|nr:SARP family transcriptional regulator [Candidatus Gracilibacteria bacterium]